MAGTGGVTASRRMTSLARAAMLTPRSTTANDTSGTPPIWAIGSNGPSVWPNPTAPQGNPPNGTLDLAHSCTAHTAATQIGQPGSRRTSTAPAPNSAGNTDSMPASASHGPTPTKLLVQGSSET